MEIKAKLSYLCALALLCLFTLNNRPAQADPAALEAMEVYQNATFTVKFRTAGDPGDCPAPDSEIGPLQAWPADAQGAMNQVVDILDNLVNSAVPIVIDACYQLDNFPGSLAFAGEIQSFTKDDVPALLVADVTYAVALANAISGADQNGARSEIMTSVNSNVSWDFCTTGCLVDPNKTDFVSTMVHEVLHGMGFSMSFEVDDEQNPTSGRYNGPAISDSFVYSYDGTNTVNRLIDLENDSAALLNAFLGGSGTVVLDSPSVRAANDGKPAFIYSTANWENGSSMSHFDDNHPDNVGRMMNSATGDGPSSRTVDAITLAFLKDIGWSVNEAQDLSDGTTYPQAGHIASSQMVNHIKFGLTVTTESSPAFMDNSDNGIAKIGTWSVGTAGGTVQIDVQSGTAGAQGCLNGWADWNNDNDFADTDEQIFTMMPIGTSNGNHSFDIPAGVDPETEHTYRFRLHQDWDNDGQCNDQVGVSSTVTLMNGEVEDFIFPTPPAPILDQFIYLPLVVR